MYSLHFKQTKKQKNLRFAITSVSVLSSGTTYWLYLRLFYTAEFHWYSLLFYPPSSGACVALTSRGDSATAAAERLSLRSNGSSFYWFHFFCMHDVSLLSSISHYPVLYGTVHGGHRVGYYTFIINTSIMTPVCSRCLSFFFVIARALVSFSKTPTLANLCRNFARSRARNRFLHSVVCVFRPFAANYSGSKYEWGSRIDPEFTNARVRASIHCERGNSWTTVPYSIFKKK